MAVFEYLLFLLSFISRTARTMSRAQRRSLEDKMAYVDDFVKRKKVRTNGAVFRYLHIAIMIQNYSGTTNLPIIRIPFLKFNIDPQFQVSCPNVSVIQLWIMLVILTPCCLSICQLNPTCIPCTKRVYKCASFYFHL